MTGVHHTHKQGCAINNPLTRLGEPMSDFFGHLVGSFPPCVSVSVGVWVLTQNISDNVCLCGSAVQSYTCTSEKGKTNPLVNCVSNE